MTSYALKPVDYCNWFFDGQPSPLQFGIGTMSLADSKFVAAIVSNEKPHAVPRITDLAVLEFLSGVVGDALLGRATSRAGK